MAGRAAEGQFEKFIAIKCPSTLSLEIGRAAASEATSKSDYVRRAVIRQLRADGFEPLPSHHTDRQVA